MQIALGITIGALVVVLVVLVQRGTRRPGEPVSDPMALERRIDSALGRAMSELARRARDDRNESIKLAADRVVESSAVQLGSRAESISQALSALQANVDRQVTALDTALAELREHSSSQFGQVSNAVALLAQRTENLNNMKTIWVTWLKSSSTYKHRRIWMKYKRPRIVLQSIFFYTVWKRIWIQKNPSYLFLTFSESFPQI